VALPCPAPRVAAAGRRRLVRHHRHVAALPPHRRHRARHRRHQRLPHADDGPGHAAVGRPDPEGPQHPQTNAAAGTYLPTYLHRGVYPVLISISKSRNTFLHLIYSTFACPAFRSGRPPGSSATSPRPRPRAWGACRSRACWVTNRPPSSDKVEDTTPLTSSPYLSPYLSHYIGPLQTRWRIFRLHISCSLPQPALTRDLLCYFCFTHITRCSYVSPLVVVDTWAGCFGVGDAKCTYGTGAFLLMNTGEHCIPSTR
jgi:hypothetical protein